MAKQESNKRATRRNVLKASSGMLAASLAAPLVVERARAATMIKLGGLLPLSGSQGSTGNIMKLGMELAVDILNNGNSGVSLAFADWHGIPSLDHAKIEMIWGDTRSQPAVGQDLARRMIVDQKVIGLIGAFNSDVTAAASTVAERLKVPMINAASSSPALTKRHFKYFFRTGPDEQTFTEEVFLFLDGLKSGKSHGVPAVPAVQINRIAICTETTDIGRLLAGLYEDAAKKHGYKVVTAAKFQLGSPDLTSQVDQLKAANPDVLLVLAGVSDAILLTRTMKREGLAPKVYYNDDYGSSDPSYLKTLGSDADNGVLRSVFSDKLLGKPVAKQVNALFQKMAGVPLTDLSSRAFCAMQAWIEVLNKAGSTKADAIVKAAEAITIPEDQTIMPWKGINFTTTKFGDTHQNALGRGLILQYQKGQGQVVWPFELATSELVFPFHFVT